MSRALPGTDSTGGRLRWATAVFILSLGAWWALAVSRGRYALPTSDLTVYRMAGLSLWHHPGALYHALFGFPAALPFTYTPFAALLFAVPAGLPLTVWQVVLTAAGIVSLPLALYFAAGMAGIRERAACALACAAVALWFEPVFMNFYFGQINLILLLAVVADLSAGTERRWRGALVGIAAAIKLTPLIFVVYLLATRQFRAAATALGVFAATIVVGLVLLPGPSMTYWSGGFLGNTAVKIGALGRERVQNQSLNAIMVRATHDGPHALAFWLAASLLIVVIGITTAVFAARRGQPLLGLLLTAATGLLISPVSWTHHWVFAVLGLPLAVAALRNGGLWARVAVLAAALLITVFTIWPTDLRAPQKLSGLLRLAPHAGGLEYRWSGLTLVLGNLYAVAALAFIAIAAAAVLPSRKNDQHPTRSPDLHETDSPAPAVRASRPGE
ncbi:MAG: hypothetical protein JWN00_5458 [Actinomycetia bacterium]|nr:hypothetical protein [Actinomycetes bacterium]